MTRRTQLKEDVREVAAGVKHPSIVRPRLLLVILALIYYACAIPATWNIIAHATASTDAIDKVLAPRGVLVVIEAEHLCMSMRGVKKPGTVTVTSSVRGLFRSDVATRAEAMQFIRGR